jgi:hypothetical protein
MTSTSGNNSLTTTLLVTMLCAALVAACEHGGAGGFAHQSSAWGHSSGWGNSSTPVAHSVSSSSPSLPRSATSSSGSRAPIARPVATSQPLPAPKAAPISPPATRPVYLGVRPLSPLLPAQTAPSELARLLGRFIDASADLLAAASESAALSDADEEETVDEAPPNEAFAVGPADGSVLFGADFDPQICDDLIPGATRIPRGCSAQSLRASESGAAGSIR